MDVREQFGRILRQARTTRGLTQEELAFRAGMSVPYLSEIERGRSAPSLSMLVDLAAALDMRMAELFATFEIAGSRPEGGRKRPKE